MYAKKGDHNRQEIYTPEKYRVSRNLLGNYLLSAVIQESFKLCMNTPRESLWVFFSFTLFLATFIPSFLLQLRLWSCVRVSVIFYLYRLQTLSATSALFN